MDGRIQGRRVHVPLFELQSNPTVRLTDVKRRFLDVLCPVCGVRVPDLLEHCRDAGDPEHQVLEVMAS